MKKSFVALSDGLVEGLNSTLVYLLARSSIANCLSVKLLFESTIFSVEIRPSPISSCNSFWLITFSLTKLTRGTERSNSVAAAIRLAEKFLSLDDASLEDESLLMRGTSDRISSLVACSMILFYSFSKLFDSLSSS